MEENPTWVCCKVDMSRAAVLETLEVQPDLRHMAWYFAISMAAASTLEYGNKVWGEVGDGLLQVRPSSMELPLGHCPPGSTLLCFNTFFFNTFFFNTT